MKIFGSGNTLTMPFNTAHTLLPHPIREEAINLASKLCKIHPNCYWQIITEALNRKYKLQLRNSQLRDQIRSELVTCQACPYLTLSEIQKELYSSIKFNQSPKITKNVLSSL